MMMTKPLICLSIYAVVLLVMGSLTNVVGYQSVKSTTMSDSPLFCIRSQRILHHKQNMITTQYLGQEKGVENDTTPPVTICILNPLEPNGENDWYISNIIVTLTATDDYSGVNKTEFQIDGGAWQTYLQPFNMTIDGRHEVMYRSIDNAGNREPTKSVTFAMDHTKPVLFLWYNTTGNPQDGWDLIFYATASDYTSGMNRTEFYLNDELQETVLGSGPEYEWIYHFPTPSEFGVRGIIRNREITEGFVKFYGIIVMIIGFQDPHAIFSAIAYDHAGNKIKDTIEEPSFRVPIKSGLYLFQDMILPNNYTGYIGRFIIRATFYNT